MKSSDPTAWGRAICTLKCKTVYITHYRSMKIPVSFRTTYTRADKNILVDSGATDNFIDPRLIRRLRLGTHNLEQARKIWNIDGTNNKAGLITNYVDLSIQTGQKQAKMRFLIMDLGNKDLILGYPWLVNFEPKFSWSEGGHRHLLSANHHFISRLGNSTKLRYHISDYLRTPIRTRKGPEIGRAHV